MKDFRTLTVWQKSHELTLSVYGMTKGFPKEEVYGISSQLRRAMSSVPTNLAEGCGRGSDKDFKRFVQIAMASACESEYLFLLCHDLKYVSLDEYNDLKERIIEIKKMLVALIMRLK